MREIRLGARVGVSVAILVVLGVTLDAGEVLRQLGEARLSWIVPALLVSVAQVAASAWRWRFTAKRIGLELPFPEALREYYLASFLNQVLPGGVLGDVSRAWRQARIRASRGSAARAVVLERASGQAVILTTASVCLAVLAFTDLLSGSALLRRPVSGVPIVGHMGELLGGLGGGALLLGVMGLGVAGVVVRWKGVPDGPDRWTASGWRRLRAVWRQSWSEARSALLSPGAFLLQTTSSLFVVGTYVLVFILSARAVGVETPASVLALLIPPVLVAMLIPVSLAGWGLREGAAAVLWTLTGLPASEGMAASVMYGLLVLAASLPGAVVLVWFPVRGDGGRRSPSGTRRTSSKSS